MSYLKSFAVIGMVLFSISHATNLIGLEVQESWKLDVKPIQLSLPDDPFLPYRSLKVSIESLDPRGKRHKIVDQKGQGQWALEQYSSGEMIQIKPSLSSYAGPLQVRINGKIVDQFNQFFPGGRKLILEKVLHTQMADGTQLKVHYTDFVLDKSPDPTYPHRILRHMTKAYPVLKNFFGYQPEHDLVPLSFDVYLGDAESSGLFPFGGYEDKDYQRAPLFVIRDDPYTGEKKEGILLPANYRKFLKFWNKINSVPYDTKYHEDEYLASSVMHEMTHAMIHRINENLGSTEHEIHNGDWFTEGLARYLETKMGSDPGFASEGFRKKVDDKIQFSRGGANYYLRYPDESFFTLRYENSLFWLYFEKVYGIKMIRSLSHNLKQIPFDATPENYIDILQRTIQKPFHDVLDDYFNWIYRGDYQDYEEGKHLLPVAMTKVVWSDNRFYIYPKKGDLLYKSKVLDIDWVPYWSWYEAKDMDDVTGGDWTKQADIKPLAFDVQQILMTKSHEDKIKIVVENTGESHNLKITFYIEGNHGIRTIKETLGVGGKAVVEQRNSNELAKIGIVLSNLDPNHSTTYQISID